MKIEDKKFDFKFLNFMLYFGFAVAIYFLLKNIGIMDKIVQAIGALVPVFLGIVLCWISSPLTNRLRKMGFGKNLSAILSLVIIFGLIIVVFSIVVPLFVSEFSSLVKDFPNIYDNIVDKINPFMNEKLNIESNIKHFNEIISKDMILDNLDNILTYSISTLQSVFSFFVTIGTTIVVSFFMVKDMDKFKERLMMFFSRNGKGGKTYKMLTQIDGAVMSYVKGTILDSIIVGILTTIACMILGLDYAVVFGILITILNLIPYIGALLSELIVALYALTVGGPVFALITFACLLLVQLIDANILQPNIIGKSVNLHPVVVIGGLIVFNLLFGIVGMIIAMPVLAIGKIIIEYKFSVQFDEIETKADVAKSKKENRIKNKEEKEIKK
ncbi:MAG: AI-2E family transporter [Clostridia bacterium]|nr:AI-2E family transporter [Clostridia bacterium]